MSKRSDINLIPSELKEQRKLIKVRSTVKVGTIVISILIFLVSVLFFSYRIKLNYDSTSLKSSLSREAQKVKDLSSIEADSKRLKLKTDSISKILSSVSYFSHLLDNFSESIPSDVTITNFSTISDNKIVVSGSALSYVALAKFILTSVDPNFGGKVFSSVDLTSVSLDELTGRAKFSLVLYLKSNILYQAL